MSRKQYFCQLTPAEQKLALELEGLRAAYTRDRKAIEDSNVACSHRLAIQPYLVELETASGFQGDALAQLRRAHAVYIKQQNDQLDTNNAAMARIEAVWEGTRAKLQTHIELISAVLEFERRFQMLPELDADCPAPEALATGLDAYMALVARELETTRQWLLSYGPALISQYTFRCAAESLEMGFAGQPVGEAIDELRSVRQSLRRLAGSVAPAA